MNGKRHEPACTVQFKKGMNEVGVARCQWQSAVASMPMLYVFFGW